MMNRGRYVTIVVHADGSIDSRTWRIPRWMLQAAGGGALALAALLLLGAALYLPVLRQAARVPGLVREIERLDAENQKIGQLVAALDSAERRYDRIRGMLGADLVPDPVALTAALPVAPPIHARLLESSPPPPPGPSPPSLWPLDEPGFVTRGLTKGASPAGGDEAHPGMDIAVPPGSPVRAAGGGEVLQAGEEKEYGIYVLLQHPGGLQSLYGHLSRTTVSTGQRVDAGHVIGLSGSTGRSSAPHLHFEIRRDGEVIDPSTMVKEQS